MTETQETTYEAERTLLVAAYKSAVRRCERAVTARTQERAEEALDEAWDALVEWKRDHNECYVVTCTNPAPSAPNVFCDECRA